jgi:hypothetical protein
MDSIKKELEKYERSGYKRLGVKIKQALVYAKKEWHAFETVLQNGDVELSNNICYHNLNIIPTFHLTAQRIAD